MPPRDANHNIEPAVLMQDYELLTSLSEDRRLTAGLVMLLSNHDGLAACVLRDMRGDCSSSTRSRHIQHYQNNMTCPHPLPRSVFLFHASPSAGFSLLIIPPTCVAVLP
jgi:hypothetical protein